MVRNVQYTPGWQAALGPLSPQTAASVRIDNRQGRAATVTLKLSDTTVDSATASLISGTTLVEEKGVSVSLALPKGKWFSGSGADLTKSGVWCARPRGLKLVTLSLCSSRSWCQLQWGQAALQGWEAPWVELQPT